MDALLTKSTDKIWIRRPPNCPFNLYSTLSTKGSNVYSLCAALPKHFSIKDAIIHLQNLGWDYSMNYEVQAKVDIWVEDVNLRYIYRDKRYRYSSLRKAMQTLSNLKNENWKGYSWSIVCYYFD